MDHEKEIRDTVYRIMCSLGCGGGHPGSKQVAVLVAGLIEKIKGDLK